MCHQKDANQSVMFPCCHLFITSISYNDIGRFPVAKIGYVLTLRLRRPSLVSTKDRRRSRGT
jgi:hypothetical protein